MEHFNQKQEKTKTEEAGDWMTNVNEANFAEEVLQASIERLVLVDFWAEWCGPCKQLTPIIEKVIAQYGGLVRLAKVDVDQNQMLAGQMQIRSIPSVYMFLEGKVVDGFVGVLDGADITAKIDQVLEKAGLTPQANQDTAFLWQEVDRCFEEQNFQEAEKKLGQILVLEQDNRKAEGIFCHLRFKRGEMSEDEAREILARIEQEGGEELEETRKGIAALISFDEEARAMVETDDIGGELASQSLEDLYAQAIGKIARRDFEKALEVLLFMIKRDATWQEGQAREAYVRLLTAMGDFDEGASVARSRLSNVLFA